MRIDIVDDWPNDLVPVNETRVCDKCGAYTWWATPRQPKRGRCLDCMPGIWDRDVSPAHFNRILANLLRTFPGSHVSVYRPVALEPDTYNGPDVGPCEGCRRRVRRYGANGYPLCAQCLARRGDL